MDLETILKLRGEPLAGIYLSLTQRCPLHCAHCSTESTLTGEQIASDELVAFVRSMPYHGTPSLLYFTGGEALMRPKLIETLTGEAHARSISTVLLTGGFFLRHSDRAPDRIWSVLASQDHVSLSVDRFHEDEVPRARVLALLTRLAASGVDTSVQLTGTNLGDPYIETAIQDIRSRTEGQTPILVSLLAPVGRAKQLVSAEPAVDQRVYGEVIAQPCAAANWPVYTWDGRVTACCNQEVVGRRAPTHLSLSETPSCTWRETYVAHSRSDVVKAIRLVGPRQLAALSGGEVRVATANKDYCSTCLRLSDARWEAAVTSAARRATREPLASRMEDLLARRYAIHPPGMQPGYDSLTRVAGGLHS